MLRSIPQEQFDQISVETIVSQMLQDYPKLVESFTTRLGLSDANSTEQLHATFRDLNTECLSGNIDTETERGIISALEKDLSDFFQKFWQKIMHDLQWTVQIGEQAIAEQEINSLPIF